MRRVERQVAFSLRSCVGALILPSRIGRAWALDCFCRSADRALAGLAASAEQTRDTKARGAGATQCSALVYVVHSPTQAAAGSTVTMTFNGANFVSRSFNRDLYALSGNHGEQRAVWRRRCR